MALRSLRSPTIAPAIRPRQQWWPCPLVQAGGCTVRRASSSTRAMPMRCCWRLSWQAARLVGAAQRVFDLTLRYTGERSQFGQPLLRFQALNFRLAALLTRIDGARMLAYHAAWLIDQGQEFAHAALFAKAQAAEMYRETAAEAIQLHGGFGFTAEASPQLFYRRAAADAMLLGNTTTLRERIAGYLALS